MPERAQQREPEESSRELGSDLCGAAAFADLRAARQTTTLQGPAGRSAVLAGLGCLKPMSSTCSPERCTFGLDR